MTQKFTSKQMGDACEMLVAGELMLAGVPASKMPDHWPHYDVVAQPFDKEPQRISVKSRRYKVGQQFVDYSTNDKFDWLAIVILPDGINEKKRRLYLIPRKEADEKARQDKPTSKNAHKRGWRIDEISKVFPKFEGNFSLDTDPSFQTVVGG